MIIKERLGSTDRETFQQIAENLHIPSHPDTRFRSIVTASELCRKHGMSDATFYNWRKKYGGMTVSDVRRLKDLELENSRLKRIVADKELEIDALKDVLSKNW